MLSVIEIYFFILSFIDYQLFLFVFKLLGTLIKSKAQVTGLSGRRYHGRGPFYVNVSRRSSLSWRDN